MSEGESVLLTRCESTNDLKLQHSLKATPSALKNALIRGILLLSSGIKIKITALLLYLSFKCFPEHRGSQSVGSKCCWLLLDLLSGEDGGGSNNLLTAEGPAQNKLSEYRRAVVLLCHYLLDVPSGEHPSYLHLFASFPWESFQREHKSLFYTDTESATLWDKCVADSGLWYLHVTAISCSWEAVPLLSVNSGCLQQ